MCTRTITQFYLRKSWPTSKYMVVKAYECHRSGKYKSHRTKEPRDLKEHDDRKRCLKLNGSKKLGGVCPAEIRVKCLRSTGACIVDFQTTHVGHPIEDESELRYIGLDEDEKIHIATKIQDGVPLRTLLSNPSTVLSENKGRLSVLTSDDVRNACRRFGITVKSEQGHDGRAVAIDSIIDENRESILFFKDQFQEDNEFGVLNIEDFVVVIMNKVQEDNLRRYGHKMVAFEGTGDANPFGIVMHALLVVDVDFEGVPVAFILTNRNDRTVINIFFECIRQRVGLIRPRTLVTDMWNSYYDSWISVMERPEYRIYCLWYVLERWRDKLYLIDDKMKKEEIRKLIHDMAYESESHTFEEKLRAFLWMEDEDLQVKQFQKYFQDNFLNNRKCWACCYRSDSGVNTNMRLEGFHNMFRRDVCEGKRVKSLREGLTYIFDYILTRKIRDRTKLIRGYITSQLKMLRTNHKLCLEYLNAQKTVLIETINDTIWRVNSLQETISNTVEEWFTVTRVELKECSRYADISCQLPCLSCKVCFHEFMCTCKVYRVGNHMCQHIHIIGIYLRNQNNTSEPDLVELPDSASFPEDMTLTEETDDKKNALVNNSTPYAEEFENLKKAMVVEFESSLSTASSVAELKEIYQLISPIIQKIKPISNKT